ncbi:MAG: hypothetical protein B6U95_08155, partial [Thermofilum sp. ex4484_82]
MITGIAGYHLIKLIGTNGSEVWLAKKNGKQYAVKIPKMNVLKTFTRKDIEEFLEKAEAWEKLCEKHENIVKIYEYGLKPLPYIVMEYCETNLREVLREKGNLSVKEVKNIAIKILEALNIAHHHGVVHRDIKPENILLHEGEPRIGDWGIAKILLKTTTKTGYAGTPIYSAPEQLNPKEYGEVDWRTDIWQIGCLLYEMLTGKPPFQAEYPGQLAIKILTEETEPITTAPQWIKEIILGCLRKRKEERWQSTDIILKMLKTENVEKIERKKETITFRTPSILPPIEIVKRTIKGLKKFTTSEIATKTNLLEENVEKILELLAIKSSKKGIWYSEDCWEELKQTAKTILEKKTCKISNLASALGIAEEDAKKIAKEISAQIIDNDIITENTARKIIGFVEKAWRKKSHMDIETIIETSAAAFGTNKNTIVYILSKSMLIKD